LTGQITLTAAELTVALETNAAAGRWVDEDGTRYIAVLLRAQVASEWRVVGIAMLSEDDPELAQSLQPFAAALASNLIASGDFVGVLAA
jgi:hypothetical protein